MLHSKRRRFKLHVHLAPGAQTGFPVDEVAPTRESLWTETLEASLKRRYQRPIVALPGA